MTQAFLIYPDDELFMYLIQVRLMKCLASQPGLNHLGGRGGHYNWSVFTVAMIRELHEIICGPCWGSFTLEDHLRSGDHLRWGIICSTVQVLFINCYINIRACLKNRMYARFRNTDLKVFRVRE